MTHDNDNLHAHAETHEAGSDETSTDAERDAKKSNRGFASMDPSKQREIASKGGRAAHEKGTAHQFSSDEARAAGRKGGGTVSRDRQHMAEIGRIGGQARGRKQRATSAEPRKEGEAKASDTKDEPVETRH